VWLKLECEQPTGSFKVRGASNRFALLTPDERKRGIVTASAGNHGLGVAHAARHFPETVVHVFVPVNAPRAKVVRMQFYPVIIHEEGGNYDEAHQAALSYAERCDCFHLSAYDDLDVIAGQGTIALELLEDLEEPDVVIVPVGGGGLIAGICSVTKELRQSCRVVGVQPEASPAALVSFQKGRAQDPFDHGPTIADGLAGGFGELPFEITRSRVDEILLATEDDLREAIYALLDREQLVTEAAAASAVTPLLNHTIDVEGKAVIVVLTGRNIETALLREILEEFR
jgi:threonine dehydratase